MWRTWVLSHIFKGIFRGFTIMSSLCKCLSHFTLFYLMLPYFDIKAIFLVKRPVFLHFLTISKLLVNNV